MISSYFTTRKWRSRRRARQRNRGIGLTEAEMKNYVESNDIVETDLEEDKLHDVKIKPSIQDTEK